MKEIQREVRARGKEKTLNIYMYEQSSLVGGRGSEEDTNLSTGREVNCAFF